MTPDQIAAIQPRRLRVKHVHDYRRAERLSYAGAAEQLGVSRNTVAGDERDYRRWYGDKADGDSAGQQSIPAANGERVVYPAWTNESKSPLIISKHPLLRAAIADIEVTDFNSEGFAGYLICVCILPLDAEIPQTYTIQHSEFGDDKRLLQDVSQALAEFDIIAGHNWSAFDYNWLLSKLMFYRLPPLRSHWIFDTYQVAKTMGLKTRKGLGNLVDYFGLEGEKTTIYRKSWNDIRHPNVDIFNKTLANIVYHCSEDVIANRNLLEVLLPYSMTMKTNPFKTSKMLRVDFGNQERIA